MTRGRGSVRNDERDSSPALPSGLDVLEHRRDVIVAAHGCVMFRIWRAPGTLESMERCEAAFERFAAEYSRYGTLTVVERDVGAPPAEVRQAAGRLMARFGANTANALVIEGTGFKQTGMRLTITTIQLLAPSATPQPVFSSIDEASAWLEAQLPGVSAAQLTRDIAALRALRSSSV